MSEFTVVIADDEQDAVEPLADGLLYEGFKVLKARSGDEILNTLTGEDVSLLIIDVMMAPGPKLRSEGVTAQVTGLEVVKRIRRTNTKLKIFCLSVVSNPVIIDEIKEHDVKFFPKGETPLRTVLAMVRSALTGIAYDSKNERRWSFGE